MKKIPHLAYLFSIYCVISEVQAEGSDPIVWECDQNLCCQLNGKNDDEFRAFIEKHKDLYSDEITDILKRLKVIGTREGAREHYFKKAEGLPGDLVCALYDLEEAKLRLYCIRLGSDVIILGGGANKPPDIRAWQEKDDLRTAAELMIRVSKDFLERMKEKEIRIDDSTNRLVGNLEFGEDDDEE